MTCNAYLQHRVFFFKIPAGADMLGAYKITVVEKQLYERWWHLEASYVSPTIKKIKVSMKKEEQSGKKR